jgi:hypothetical protein
MTARAYGEIEELHSRRETVTHSNANCPPHHGIVVLRCAAARHRSSSRVNEAAGSDCVFPPRQPHLTMRSRERSTAVDRSVRAPRPRGQSTSVCT